MFGVGSSGLKVWGLGLRILSGEVRRCRNRTRAISMTCPQGLGLRVWGLGIEVWGLRFEVWGSGLGY